MMQLSTKRRSLTKLSGMKRIDGFVSKEVRLLDSFGELYLTQQIHGNNKRVGNTTIVRNRCFFKSVS